MHSVLLAAALLRAAWSFHLAGSPENRFEDDAIVITWSMENELAFALHNKTANPIELLWSEGSYVDDAGHAHRLMPNGDGWMRPWADICRAVVTLDAMRWKNGNWVARPLLPSIVRKPPAAKHLQVILPIRIGSTTRRYTFRLNANAAVEAARNVDIDVATQQEREFAAGEPAEEGDAWSQIGPFYCAADEERDDILACRWTAAAAATGCSLRMSSRSMRSRHLLFSTSRRSRRNSSPVLAALTFTKSPTLTISITIVSTSSWSGDIPGTARRRRRSGDSTADT